MKHSTFALFVYLALAASAAPNPRKSQDISGILSSAISSLSAARASAASVAAASSATAATAVSSVADTSSAAAATSVAVATTVASSAAAASSTAATGSDDSQSSLTLLETVIANGFQDDGNEPPVANQEASQTSSNNFINFCATVEGKPITNGLQIKEGSCNPAPMGVIAAQTNMPSSKFVFPTNDDASIKTNTTFTISMAIKNLETGHFVNAASNYFAAPQIVNAEGNIKGHSHVVIESLPSLDSTEPTDPSTNVFFKGLNDQDVNGILTAEVPGGLPAGFYRLASINTAANHQPALVAVAQHGALDDMVYFTITD